MIQKVRELEKALGDGRKAVHPVEAELKRFGRRSIFAIRGIGAGEVFTRENIAVLRCGNLERGLEPKHFEAILGKRAQQGILAERAIRREDYV